MVTTAAGVYGGTLTTLYLPVDIAIDPQTRSFYIAEYGNKCIRMLTQAAMQLSTPTMSVFATPIGFAQTYPICLWGVAVDSSGNVYFTDTCYHLVYVATSSGVVSNNLFKL